MHIDKVISAYTAFFCAYKFFLPVCLFVCLLVFWNYGKVRGLVFNIQRDEGGGGAHLPCFVFFLSLSENDLRYFYQIPQHPKKGFANKAWPKAFYPPKLLFHVTRLVRHEDAWGEQKHSLLVNNPVILPWQESCPKKLLYRSQLIIKMTSSNIIAKDPGVSDLMIHEPIQLFQNGPPHDTIAC